MVVTEGGGERGVGLDGQLPATRVMNKTWQEAGTNPTPGQTLTRWDGSGTNQVTRTNASRENEPDKLTRGGAAKNNVDFIEYTECGYSMLCGYSQEFPGVPEAIDEDH